MTTLAQLNERIKRAKEDEELKISLEKIIAEKEKEKQTLVELANYLVKRYKNIKAYAQEHRKRVKSIVDLAIEQAGDLVPDADVKGIHMDPTEDGKVYVCNGDGNDVNAREGGGYRAVLGALLRYAALKSQPDALQFIIYDEYFFTLSDVTTSAMQTIFEKMKEDISVVVIEQRRNVMAGITDKEFTFTKVGPKHSVITDTTGKMQEEVPNEVVAGIGQ